MESVSECRTKKKKKKKNFVIYGVEEEHLELGCAKNSSQIADIVFCAIEANPNIYSSSPSRTVIPENKTSGKQRPIKMTLGSPEAVKFVLSDANKLRYSKE